MKLDKKKLFYLFLLIQPFLDLVTGIMTRFEISIISLGIVIRGLFILCMVIYLLFFCNTKFKRVSIFYVFLLIIYGALYFITKTDLIFNTSFLINDFIYLFKYLYFLVLFITVLNYYIQYKLDYKDIIKCFVVIACIYSLLILIPCITHTSFSSYANNRGEGIVGWFYAANDISNIFITLFPFILFKVDEKISIKYIILVFMVMASCFLIGTKVAYFGLLVPIVLLLFYYLFYFKKKIKNIGLLIIFLIGMIVSTNFIPVFNNIENRVKKYNEFQETGTNKVKEETEIKVKEDDSKASIVVFSSRDRLLKNTYKIYEKRNIGEKLFGIGFSNRDDINNKKIEKLVEMDFFDILFHLGIVAVILYIIPFVFALVSFIKYFKKNKLKLDLYKWMLGFLVAFLLCISTTSGHLFSSPSALIYYSLVLIMFVVMFDVHNKKLNKKKISFLLLHLGHGGIEKATVETANSLCDKYEVELIVDYINEEDNIYDINKKIKVKYLINSDIAFKVLKYKEMLRNRETIKLYVTLMKDYNGNIFKIIRDVIKSFWVRRLKSTKMIKYIKSCDSGTIISTRVEFSTFLSSYGRDDCNKIAVEHRHHNNDKKYIKDIKYNYDNINYLVVLTDGLNKDYSSFLRDDSTTKVVTIPNMITNYPKKKSSLDKKKVISIGRIVEGKKVDEILKVAYNLKEKHSDWEFVIIGDGDKLEEMKSLVEERKLDNVKLTGYMSNSDCLKELESSSMFIMTSVTEGLPMVLLESFSYGVPVVCYKTDSGVCDIVDNEVNGFVIENRDRVEMIRKVDLLMRDKKLRTKFGKEAVKKSLLFNKDEIVKKWEKIL